MSVLSLLPIASRLRARIFGNAAIDSQASEIIEISPSVQRKSPAAICLPNELQRIQGWVQGSSLELQLNRVTGGVKEHGATVGYRLRNATIAGGSLYFRGGYDVLRPKQSRVLVLGRPERIAEAQLCTTFVAERFFGHWLRDALMLEELASLRGYLPVRLRRGSWLHEEAYRNLLGLPGHSVDFAQIAHLWVIDDRGLNDSWLSRFESLRERTRRTAAVSGPSRVMLCRGVMGERRELTNAAEVESELQANGFVVATPELESVAQLINLLAHAKIVVVVEGSAHNHAFMAMPRGSALITIQPSNRFNAIGKTFADAIGVRWAFTVAEKSRGGYYMPLDRLLRTIESVGCHL
jgi:Glycosyltransferase 61